MSETKKYMCWDVLEPPIEGQIRWIVIQEAGTPNISQYFSFKGVDIEVKRKKRRHEN